MRPRLRRGERGPARADVDVVGGRTVVVGITVVVVNTVVGDTVVDEIRLFRGVMVAESITTATSA